MVRVEGAEAWAVLREASAAIAAGAEVRFSAREPLADGLAEVLAGAGLAVGTAPDRVFDQTAAGRIRHLGTRDLLAYILKSEEEHVDTIEAQFDLIERMGIHNYIQLQSSPVED